MSDGTSIEWTDATANYVNGCSVVSPGCTNCYAMRLAGTRMRGHPSRAGLTRPSKAGPVWTGEVRLSEAQLLAPLKWRRPRRIFWNAHGDLFHPNVPDEWIDRVFAVCALTPQHTHMILTKRPERMREYLNDADRMYERGREIDHLAERQFREKLRLTDAQWDALDAGVEKARWAWPLPNVWLGTSVEDQPRADERIPHLLAAPAAVRFLSCEPLLGPVDLTTLRDPIASNTRYDGLSLALGASYVGTRIDWVIAGGESGPGARPMHPDWARSLRDQCAAAGVPFFFKQWGEWAPLAGDDGEWPHDSGAFIRMTPGGDRDPAGWPFQRVGKKHAGRLLDGELHDGMPA